MNESRMQQSHRRSFVFGALAPLTVIQRGFGGSVMHDDLHLNDLGNAIWGATIKAALMPREARFEPSLAQ